MALAMRLTCLEPLQLDLLLADHLEEPILSNGQPCVGYRGVHNFQVTHNMSLLLGFQLLMQLAQTGGSMVVGVTRKRRP